MAAKLFADADLAANLSAHLRSASSTPSLVQGMERKEESHGGTASEVDACGGKGGDITGMEPCGFQSLIAIADVVTWLFHLTFSVLIR